MKNWYLSATFEILNINVIVGVIAVTKGAFDIFSESLADAVINRTVVGC